MELNKIRVGDKFVFTGDLENFNLNQIYTISKIYKIDYLVDQGDQFYGKDCVNFEDSKYGCFLVDLPKQFTNINYIREQKINSLLQ
jgi:hypothetical protein